MKQHLPKYERIKNYLLQGIASRNFVDLLPSENQLAEKFNVSRMTARRALDELGRQGSVERVPGKGTFVRRPERYTRGFFRVRPFRKWAEDLGAVLRTEVVESRIIEPPPEIARTLQAEDQVILLRILNFLDDIPVRLAIRHLRADTCGGILFEDLETASIHDILINKYRLALSRIDQTMTAVGLPPSLCTWFREPAGFPMFHFRRVTYTAELPVTHVEYYMRGDMAFKDSFTPQVDYRDFGAADRPPSPEPERLATATSEN